MLRPKQIVEAVSDTFGDNTVGADKSVPALVSKRVLIVLLPPNDDEAPELTFSLMDSEFAAAIRGQLFDSTIALGFADANSESLLRVWQSPFDDVDAVVLDNRKCNRRSSRIHGLSDGGEKIPCDNFLAPQGP